MKSTVGFQTRREVLLLSGVLSASKADELQQVVEVLDPLRLFRHLQDLQQALLGCTTSTSPDGKETAPATIRSFCIEHCIPGSRHLDPASGEEARQEHMTRAIMADPVVSSQPKQDRNHRALLLHREACSSPIAPAHQSGQARVFPSQPREAEQETRCPPTPTNDGAIQRG